MVSRACMRLCTRVCMCGSCGRPGPQQRKTGRSGEPQPSYAPKVTSLLPQHPKLQDHDPASDSVILRMLEKWESCSTQALEMGS